MSAVNKRNLIVSAIVVCAFAAVLGSFMLWQAGRPATFIVTASPAPAAATAPALPDISGFTTEAVRAMIPPVAPGEIVMEEMGSSDLFDYMSMNSLIPDFSSRQADEEPKIIVLKTGVWDLASIASRLNDPQILGQEQNFWVLRRPIVVAPGATLFIRDQSNALRMIAEKGAFIASFGNLYVVDTTVAGWREERNAPSAYENAETFRPYLVFWSGSKTYLASTRFDNLGYNFPKAYGITFTTSAPMLREQPGVPRATGWVIDSFFDDIYYGFYCYEADDIAIIRNTYENNIVYGIDPHDRSNRLIIAENNAYGTKKRHGIIISREVNDSFIFNNHSHDNHGSGIMIDRASVRNVIANNLSERNGADGLVFFESPDNITWNNRLLNNGKNGIRIRNSWNISLNNDRILNNGSYGVTAYPASLEHQETRDTKYDPYTQRAGFEINGAEMSGNKIGHFRLDNVETARFWNLRLFNTPDIFKGDVEKHAGQIYTIISTPGQMATVTMKGGSIIAAPAGKSGMNETESVDEASETGENVADTAPEAGQAP